MRLAIRMPQFGEAAAEATVVAWLVQPGATVQAEQELCEVQTEKSLLTVAAPAAGILTEVHAKPGDTLKVGAILGWVGDGTAAPAAAAAANVPLANVHDVGAPPPVRQIAAAAAAAVQQPTTRLVQRNRAAVVAASGDRGFLSPRVRSLIASSGLKDSDLAFITGTGIGGRITAADVQRYVDHGEPMPPIRQAVASAMARSWSRPLATVAAAVEVDTVLAHRRTIAGRPSLTIYGLRALAVALKAGSPFAKRLYGNRMHRPETIDLACAVEVDDGVLTPVVRKVETLDLAQVTAAVDTVIDKARAGKVADAGEAVGAVSNYGVFGITWATPIPLPGHSVILGIGAVENAPVWNPASKSWDRQRQVELTLTFDHRIADGGDAARLLGKIIELFQHPERM
jgi:pyruvate/2-oxoglutarate dehydrogenase complex dihydrolipoamide acyltransferase (E2) component